MNTKITFVAMALIFIFNLKSNANTEKPILKKDAENKINAVLQQACKEQRDYFKKHKKYTNRTISDLSIQISSFSHLSFYSCGTGYLFVVKGSKPPVNNEVYLCGDGHIGDAHSVYSNTADMKNHIDSALKAFSKKIESNILSSNIGYPGTLEDYKKTLNLEASSYACLKDFGSLDIRTERESYVLSYKSDFLPFFNKSLSSSKSFNQFMEKRNMEDDKKKLQILKTKNDEIIEKNKQIELAMKILDTPNIKISVADAKRFCDVAEYAHCPNFCDRTCISSSCGSDPKSDVLCTDDCGSSSRCFFERKTDSLVSHNSLISLLEHNLNGKFNIKIAERISTYTDIKKLPISGYPLLLASKSLDSFNFLISKGMKMDDKTYSGSTVMQESLIQCRHELLKNALGKGVTLPKDWKELAPFCAEINAILKK